MKKEDQVCSLEQAIKLKESGVKQSGICLWIRTGALVQQQHDQTFKKIRDAGLPFVDFITEVDSFNEETIAVAFTVAELGLMLTGLTQEKDTHSEYNCVWEKWTSFLIDSNLETEYQIDGETEAKARAGMLIYLLEKNIISIQEVNNKLNHE